MKPPTSAGIKITVFEGNITNKFDDIDRALSEKNSFVFIKTSNLISIEALQSIIPKIQTGKCALMLVINTRTKLAPQMPLIFELMRNIPNNKHDFFMVRVDIPMTRRGLAAFEIFLRLFSEKSVIRLRNIYYTLIKGEKTPETVENIEFTSLINRYLPIVHVDYYKDVLIYSRIKQLFMRR
jgi:hypothetical protein